MYIYMNTRISGPYGPKILAPAVGLVLLASLAKGERTNGRTNMALYVYRLKYDKKVCEFLKTAYLYT